MSIQRRPRVGKPEKGKVRWVVRYRDESGKHRSTTFYTEGEAKHFDREIHRKIERGTFVDPDKKLVTVDELVEVWKRSATRPETRKGRAALQKNLGPLADMKAVAVRRSHVQQWVNTLRDGRPWANGKTLSPGSTSTYLKRLATVMAQAELDEVIERNPCKKIEIARPAVGVEKEKIPAASTIKPFVDLAGTRFGPGFKALLVTALGTGMRSSELAGLRIEDVDFIRRRVNVEQQLAADGSPAPLKTESSRRSIPLPDFVVDALVSQVNNVRTIEGSGGLMFYRDPCCQSSGPWTRTAISSAMASVSVALDVRVGIHQFRHFYASALIAAGVDVKGVQMALGHSSAVTTLKYYAHLWPSTDDRVREAANGLGWAINGQVADESFQTRA